MIKNDDDFEDPTYLPVEISSKDKLFSTWKKGQNSLEGFWKLWRDNYLLTQ